MVVLIQQILQPLSPSPLPPRKSRKKSRVVGGCISSKSMEQQRKPDGFMEFPYLSAPHKKLMVELVTTIEERLDSHLLPSSLPQDVQYFENQSGSSQGTLHIRSGAHDSPVDFLLGSWIHSKLPTGGSLNITTLTAYLNTTTDAPRFLLEFIQSSPTSLILILDLPPRKDLILHPDYLTTFYSDTQLDQFRQRLVKLPETHPYVSSSLYIRCALSPTAVSVLINCDETAGSGRMEEIIVDHISDVAKEMLGMWLDKCACGGRELEADEKDELKKRDALVNQKTLDIDLASGLPRLFGPEVANRVIQGITKYFKE